VGSGLVFAKALRNNKQVSHSIRLPVVAYMQLESFTVNCVTLLS